MKRDVLKKFLPLMAAVLVISACSTGSKDDPYESFNRVVFAGNQRVDTYLLRPVAKGYRYITPDAVRTRIGSVSDNLQEPLNMIHAFLQGDVDQGFTTMFRFFINSTVGLAGMHDVASEAGLKPRVEDFGQTLAVWGVGSGPYIVLPILGPSNMRDAFGTVADWYADPVTYAFDQSGTDWTLIGVRAGQALIARERLIDPIDDINATSLDPYASFKSIYEQRRATLISNGKVKPKAR